jgi:hypothetical protein
LQARPDWDHAAGDAIRDGQRQGHKRRESASNSEIAVESSAVAMFEHLYSGFLILIISCYFLVTVLGFITAWLERRAPFLNRASG